MPEPDDVTIELISNQQQHSSALTQSNNGNDRRRTIMPDAGDIELIDQQQHSSPLTQNNNGNDRSIVSTGVAAQETSTITDLLENKVAKMLGVVACGWVLVVLVQGGMVGSLETKDCGFVTLLFFLVFFRCWRHYCPEAYWSLSGTTRSLLADYFSRLYIDRLFNWSRLVFAMTSVVFSVMQLASQDFGKKEVANKESRDFALKVFYGLTLAEALVLLFAEALPVRWNSVKLADGPGDDLEVGLRTRGNFVPGDGPGDRPVNQSNECNGVAQMDRPANQSNDFNSEGPADSLPNLRQRQRRQREIPRSGDGDPPLSAGFAGFIQRFNERMKERGDSLPDFSLEGPADSLPDLRQRRGNIPQVRQSIECNALAQMDRPANQSNDFNLEGPANSLPNLRQRRRIHPACQGKKVLTNCIHIYSNTSKVLGWSVEEGGEVEE